MRLTRSSFRRLAHQATPSGWDLLDESALPPSDLYQAGWDTHRPGELRYVAIAMDPRDTDEEDARAMFAQIWRPVRLSAGARGRLH